MNLIQMTKKVKEKDKTRNRLIGQKELLMNGLKDLGFGSIEDAEKASLALKKTVTKMDAHYYSGEEKFKKEYEHLLK